MNIVCIIMSLPDFLFMFLRNNQTTTTCLVDQNECKENEVSLKWYELNGEVYYFLIWFPGRRIF